MKLSNSLAGRHEGIAVPSDKIVCPIDPATDDLPTLERTMRAGMNVARRNPTHGNGEEPCSRIGRIRERAPRAGQRVAASSLAGAPWQWATTAERPIGRSDEFRNGQDPVGGDSPVPAPEPEASSGRIDPSGPPRCPIREDEEDP